MEILISTGGNPGHSRRTAVPRSGRRAAVQGACAARASEPRSRAHAPPAVSLATSAPSRCSREFTVCQSHADLEYFKAHQYFSDPVLLNDTFEVCPDRRQLSLCCQLSGTGNKVCAPNAAAHPGARRPRSLGWSEPAVTVGASSLPAWPRPRRSWHRSRRRSRRTRCAASASPGSRRLPRTSPAPSPRPGHRPARRCAAAEGCRRRTNFSLLKISPTISCSLSVPLETE